MHAAGELDENDLLVKCRRISTDTDFSEFLTCRLYAHNHRCTVKDEAFSLGPDRLGRDWSEMQGDMESHFKHFHNSVRCDAVRKRCM